MTSRRKFLIGSVAVAGGFAVGYRFYSTHKEPSIKQLFSDNSHGLTQFVLVNDQGITIITPRAEMGQGIHTTLAALVAEELDVSISEVQVAHGPASNLYSNDFMFSPKKKNWKKRIKTALTTNPNRESRQLTGAQSSIRDGFIKMRKAGAAARQVLIAAAAKSWQTDPNNLTTSDGMVISPEGKKLSYIELAPLAAEIEPPENPKLKSPDNWKYLGKSQPRIDMAGKCNGQAQYAIDVKLPEMLFGVARMSPFLGSSMVSFQADQALKMRGVKEVVPLERGVVVIASNTWYAMQAAKTIDISWGEPSYPSTTSEHRNVISEAASGEPFSQPVNIGDVDQGFESSTKIEGEYWVPYLAHANMEPLNAVAWHDGEEMHVWAGTQWPTNTKLLASDITGLDRKNIQVHTTYMGCGFGRRLETDFIETAIRAANELKGKPVKVTWAREEDMTHDVYRPMSMARFEAHVEQNQLVSLDLKVSSISLWTSYHQRGLKINQNNPHRSSALTMGAGDQLYNIPNYRVTGYRATNLLPAGWLRSVGESQNSFFHESIMDEIAITANLDPIQMRLDLLDHAPSKAVISEVARISNWNEDLPENHARGMAYVLSSGAPTAQVIEIKYTETGVKIIKASVVVDVGIALDPRNIEAQVKSSLIFGLSAAINGEITVTDGKVDQTNFHDYSPLRMYQIPDIEISIIENGTTIFGVGESATASTAPALGNAIFAATGKRLRELPFENHIRFDWNS